MIVADTSVLAPLLIEGADTAASRRVWGSDSDWQVPTLWRSEFLSVLVVAVRHGVIEAADSAMKWRHATGFVRYSEHAVSGEAVLAAALRYGLSAYDGHFVALAESLGVALVTNDRQMLRACPELARPASSY